MADNPWVLLARGQHVHVIAGLRVRIAQAASGPAQVSNCDKRTDPGVHNFQQNLGCRI
jgi:hypothetical protein